MTDSDKNIISRRRPYTFDRVVRMVIAIALAAGAIWLVDRLHAVLLPFLVAWLVAYILEPFVQYNKRIFHLKGRFVAIMLTLLEAAVLLTALGFIFVPSIIDEVHQMAGIIKHYASNGASIPFIPDNIHEFLRENIDFNAIADSLTKQDIRSIANWALKALGNSITFILGLVSWLIVILYVIFIMLDYDKLIRGFRNLVPPRYRQLVYGIGHDVQFSMNHYFRGQSLVSLCVGIIFAIGFYIIGLPLGIVLGLFIGLLNMVPYLHLISLIPCTLLCVVSAVDGGESFWTLWVECMLLYIVCQAIQDLFLTPKIMGKYMGLNPAIILLSLSIWGSLLGLIGLIIALPLTTLLLSYYNRYIIMGGGNGGNIDGYRANASRAITDITETKLP